MYFLLDADKYDNIDYAKLVLAVFVIAAHSCPEQTVESDFIRNCLYQLWRVAVPLFFIFSGFLLWRKAKSLPKPEKLTRIKKFIRHSLKLYLVWTCIYLPYSIYGFYLDGISVAKSAVIFLRNLFLVGENYFSWHLWYMHGMLVAGVILFALVKWNYKLLTMCAVAVVLALTGQLIDWMTCHSVDTKALSYYYLLFTTTRNGVFMGFPFIVIGVFVAEKGVAGSRLLSVLLLLLGVGAYITGQVFTADMITVFAVAQILFKMPALKLGETVAGKCRFASTVIYFIHMIWIGALTFIFTVDSPPLKFLLAVVLSSIIAIYASVNQDSKLVKVLFK